MTTLRLTAVVAALGACGVLSAQNAPTRTPGTATPMPSTSPTEGTAADHTPPGATPTRPADPGSVNPTPATPRTEGTAADRSPPGETPVRGTADAQAPDQVTSQMNASARSATVQQARGSVLIGMDVQAPGGKSIGKVQDLVVERDGRISYVMVSGGDATQGLVAIPWNSFQSMMRDRKVVMDESRLAKAPRFARTQWQNLGEGTWSADVDRYWKLRTATR